MRPIAVLLLVALLLVGCGSSEEPESTPTPAAAAAPEATFPQVVEHEFGTTTVEKKPERIVVVGLTEQDIVLQLGYTPVATTEWYGEQPYAVWPWAQEALGDAKPTVLSQADGLELEKIASLRPDLIIGVNAGLERKTYDQLSRIAPTIGTPKGGTQYFSPWDKQVALVAQALGKPDEGAKLIQGVKERYAAAAAEHPEFKGKTATFSQNAFYDGEIYVYPAGLGTDFLSFLGFTINPKLTPLVKNPGEQVAVSEERLDVIDADVIVFATEKESDIANLKKVPTFKFLEAVRGKRAVYTDATLSGAMYFLTPLAFDYILDKLTPALADAVAGRSPEAVVGS
ncbi:ABC transporter substrate-binding protein [Solirubrobacter sp. CPCC 204708]|uniref:ABC transporter substrate-binding protein n=1 Tax=Solirubrobacter deserti TaxID=2282478 RepID=A0ABT4RI94_9ACTN|nr:ABC transporter substrate-binding protein [Solirubrobacter deserti]MBE2318897.1 ABC transporter substrate-binding protein [Solirubrobacter deserti]MDA0138278.1 ABC transporter substrate-binding protein [Solirubrobacter deserti]